MIIKIGVGIIFFFISLISPWWLFLLIGTILVSINGIFYEFIFIAFFLDLLYNSPAEKFFGFSFALTFLAIFASITTTVIKSRLKNRWLNI